MTKNIRWSELPSDYFWSIIAPSGAKPPRLSLGEAVKKFQKEYPYRNRAEEHRLRFGFRIFLDEAGPEKFLGSVSTHIIKKAVTQTNRWRKIAVQAAIAALYNWFATGEVRVASTHRDSKAAKEAAPVALEFSAHDVADLSRLLPPPLLGRFPELKLNLLKALADLGADQFQTVNVSGLAPKEIGTLKHSLGIFLKRRGEWGLAFNPLEKVFIVARTKQIEAVQGGIKHGKRA